MLRKDLLLSTGIGGFSGKRLEEFNIKFDNSERRLYAGSISLVKGITPKIGLLLNLNVPVAGKNYNSGSTFSIGFFFYKGKYQDINNNLNIPTVTCQAGCEL